MQRAEIICSLLLLLLAGIVIREALKLDIGWGDIGPKGGFFPFWLGLILALSSLTILLKNGILGWLKRAPVPFVTREGRVLFLTVLLPIAAVVPLIEILGFYLTAFLYLSLYISWTGHQRWLVALSISVLFPVAIFMIFERWFLIPLPKGLMEGYLPF